MNGQAQFSEDREQQQKKPFSYQKFQKSASFPIPLIAKNAKYRTILSLHQLKFLEYFMLPEKDQFDYVYRPGDDSFFMLNVLKQQLPFCINKWGSITAGKQQKCFKSCMVAQLGSGSGIISAHVSFWLSQMKQSPLLHLSIDINMDASFLSQKYYEHYKLPIQQINTSLFKNTLVSQKSKLWQQFKPEIILFNPPYIPVDPQEIQNEHKYLVEKIKHINQKRSCVRQREQNMIAYSYMGGTDGLSVTRKLLKSIFWDCWVYLIIMGEQGYSQINDQIKDNQFWSQHHPKHQVKGHVQLMQFMKYQNEDLFLIRVQVTSTYPHS